MCLKGTAYAGLNRPIVTLFQQRMVGWGQAIVPGHRPVPGTGPTTAPTSMTRRAGIDGNHRQQIVVQAREERNEFGDEKEPDKDDRVYLSVVMGVGEPTLQNGREDDNAPDYSTNRPPDHYSAYLGEFRRRPAGLVRKARKHDGQVEEEQEQDDGEGEIDDGQCDEYDLAQEILVACG